MKTTRFISFSKNLFLILITTALIISLNSCATKATFLNSSVVPAARGTVKVKKDGNKNYVIKIQLRNLAEAKRLSPSKNTYVVWLETEDNTIKNIGQVKSSTYLLSKKLKGSFETVSSFKPTKIFLTAEDEANIQYPSYTNVILTTDKF